ncbi:MAG: AAA family ATPase [Methylococcales bacterium]|nr:AAA family ATPase [Methylococcales bacterium]
MNKLESGEWNLQQAESWLIGQLLAYPEKLMDIEITVNHFTTESHRRIFRKITELESKSKLIDVITVSSELENEYPNEHWMSNLGQYQMDSFSPTFFNSSQIVMIENYRKREINRIVLDLQCDYDSDKAIQELMRIDHVEKKYIHTMAESAMAAIEKAEETAKKDGVTGLPSGLKLLDDAIGGFQSPDLYVIGARPAMGKTSVILNFMLKNNAEVGFFSTEQPYDQIGLRAISAESSVPARKIRLADFTDHDMNSMSAAVVRLAHKKIHIFDKGYITINELMREARRMKYNYDIKAVYVDYIQRIKSGNKERRLEVAEVVTSLKSLARELEIPVIGLAQVNRKVEERKDRRPHMGDLLESGVIEQEADVVMLLYRDEVYDKDTHDKGIIEILIDKNRHGPTGNLKFQWEGQTMQIRNLAY